MNAIDVVVIGLLVAGLVGGWRTGLVARLLSWVGLALGLVLGVRLLPVAVGWVEGFDPLVQFVAAVAVLVGLGVAGQAIGSALGARLRPVDDQGGVPTWDRCWGVAAGAAGSIVVLWLVMPIVANAPTLLSEPVRSSRSAQLFEQLLPTPPDAFDTIQELAGPTFPRVFDALDPSVPVGPPPEDAGLGASLRTQVATSIVKVQGPACYRLQTGTGFVVEPGVVVTNAHVVAGISRPDVVRDDGRTLRAEVVVFDPAQDLAVLRVEGLDRPPLPIGASTLGTTGGVFGHPMGQPLRVAPFQVSVQLRALGRDIYDASPVSRDVLVLASSLAQGDSGAPLVDAQGAVVGVAFAISPDDGGVAYALTSDSLRELLARPRLAGTSTGRCTA